MTKSLPPDFPEPGRQAVEKIRQVHTPTYVKVLEFVGANWGDLNGIDKVAAMWSKEIAFVQQSMHRLDNNLAKLTNAAATGHWEGTAREEYVNWRSDFRDNTLAKYLEGAQSVKAELDAIHGNIYSIRGHIVALAIEAGGIAVGIVSSETGIGAVEGVIALIALIGTWADYEFRVRGDLDEKGRNLENIRTKFRLDRGGGVVSMPLKTDIVTDWSDWRS